jgi:hypothetical protein
MFHHECLWRVLPAPQHWTLGGARAAGGDPKWPVKSHACVHTLL